MERQRYGTGSLAEKSAGVWRLRAYDRRDKRQLQRTFRGTEKAARRELAKLVSDVEQKLSVPTKESRALGELLDRWLDQLEANGRRPTTLTGYRQKLDHDIRPALGQLLVDDLSAEDLDRFYRAQTKRGLSGATVRQLHAILSAALHQGVKWGWLSSNPAQNASPPPPRGAAIVTPDIEQVNTLYRAARDLDPVLGTTVALAALTGARRGELAALRWSDVDLTVGRVTIARSISVVGGESHEGPTKTHAQRSVALDDAGVTVLRDRWLEMTDLSTRAGSPLVEDPFVLSYNANGATPVNPDTLSHKFATVAKACGIQCHLHSLRHFSVTTLIAAGVDIRTVAERHGHAQATMTLNRYSHAVPERDRDAAGILGRALTP